jgi:hypothetical protein
MIVIPIKDKGKLLKGMKYTASSVHNNGRNSSYIEGTLYIPVFGRQSVDLFTDENGNSIPKINYSSYTECDPSTLRSGDILICQSDRYKNLINGNLYRIESITGLHKASKYRNWIEWQIKFEGHNRKIKFNSWRFKKLPTDEARELALNAVLNDEVLDLKVDTKIRKIDALPDKDKRLILFLAKSIIDSKRRLGAIDWACNKMSTNLGIKKEDYDKFMDMPLKEILEIVKQD